MMIDALLQKTEPYSPEEAKAIRRWKNVGDADERRAKYALYLQTWWWKSKRASIFARAHGVCEICKDASAKSVHHLTYRRMGIEIDKDLLAVCDECHKKEHGIKEGAKVKGPAIVLWNRKRPPGIRPKYWDVMTPEEQMVMMKAAARLKAARPRKKEGQRLKSA